mmetsp:Transcript_38235/g.79531  ORF Transcript_38235/g.79531 Transcript_38235/m.79531 type:complete len:136 (+) Transcript_38235:574-981(+)
MPKTLEKDGGYEHQVALFGEVPLTGSMRARVYYTQVSLCTTMQTISASYLFPRDDSSADIISPFILMLDRDQKCTFGTKVINAQRLGADGVIIADNIGDTSTPLPVRFLLIFYLLETVYKVETHQDCTDIHLVVV